MKLLLNWMMACVFAWMTTPTFADDYFKSLDRIRTPPVGTTPILPCSINEKMHVLTLLKRDDIDHFKDATFEIDGDGKISDQKNHVLYEMYKGDFSNEGIAEYAIVATSGTGNYDTVNVYKIINNHLVDAKLDRVISHDLLHGGDVGPGFYGHTASPFAVIKNGKTYIRFMHFPSPRQYDKTQLVLCTYLWKKNKISLSGPNFTFSKINGELVEAKDCIS